MSRKRVKPTWAEIIFGDVMRNGWGLPLIAAAISAIISIGGAWAWLTAAKTAGDLEPLFYFAAALTFCAQWAANCALLRIRRNGGATRFLFALAYSICALLAACGVFHVQYVAREPAYAAERDARTLSRTPLTEAIERNELAIAAAQTEILEINRDARLNAWPGERAERQAAPALAIITDARAAIARSEARLAQTPAMAQTRPLDILDLFMLAASIIASIVEGVFYFGMLAERAPARTVKRVQSQNAIAGAFKIAIARLLVGPATAATLLASKTPARPRAPHELAAVANNAAPPIDFSVAAKLLGQASGKARRARSSAQTLAKPREAIQRFA